MEAGKGIKVSENVFVVNSDYWNYYYRISKLESRITGKYLFFSESKLHMLKSMCVLDG